MSFRLVARQLSSRLQQHVAAAAAIAPSRSTLVRCYASAQSYESPLQDFFNRMEQKGPTTLGSTDLTPPPERYLDCGIPESALRYSTTSYGRLMLVPHVHVNEHKVSVKIHTSKLPLNDLEMNLLHEIVGSRLNFEKEELRISSNQFASRIENKRHLVSMLNRIVFACQRLAKEIGKVEEGAV
jgi:hypothetical protein